VRSLYTHPDAYDAIHGATAEGDFLRFYSSTIKRFGVPALELGCGAGRLLIPLAARGYKIWGIDSSVPMLKRAKHKADVSGIPLQVVRADMRSFNLGRRFRTIVCAANSLQHLLHRHELEECFRSIRKHLMGRGRLVFDVFNPSLGMLLDSKSRHVGTYVNRKSAHPILVTLENTYDTATQINKGRYSLEDTETGKCTVVSFAMRQLFPAELEALLAYNGFAIETRYGDYDGRAFSASAPRQVIVATKRALVSSRR
jgi:SAM-dependent methyltransferase